MHLIVRVFLPFAAGFFVSFLFRVINAAIAPDLLDDLDIGAAGLGTMTSAYFFAFAGSQLFVGRLLDRCGPRRVQAALMIIAALGAVMFSVGRTAWFLTAARATIAVGVSASLASAVKAIVGWFPKQRVSLANGWMLTFGSLGAIAATGPSDAIARLVGWRGLFLVLAALTIAVAGVIYLVVPESSPAAPPRLGGSRGRLRDIYSDRDFLRVAPVAAMSIAIPWALQGLWAAPWLADVDHYDHVTVVRVLFAMAWTACAGGVLFGSLADRLAKHGVTTEGVFAGCVSALVLVEIAILARVPVPAYLLWAGLAVFGSLNALAFPIMSELFPKEIIGRVSSAFVMLNMASAWLVQSGMGFILARWPQSADGRHPAAAFETALAAPFVLQSLAFAWFLWSTALQRRATQAAGSP
jgi:MFS family permease